MSYSAFRKNPGPVPRAFYITTYRQDYQAQEGPPLLAYQRNHQPQPSAPRTRVIPPKMDIDPWARLRRYGYMTTNSTYGSPLAQGRTALVVKALEDLQGGEGTRQDLLPALSTSSSGSKLRQAPSSSSSPSGLRAAPPPPGPAPKTAWTQEVGAPRQPMTSLRPTEEDHSLDHLSSLCRAAKMDGLLHRQNHSTATTTINGKGTQVDETTNHQRKISRALIGRGGNSFPNPPTRQLKCRPWYSEYADKFGVPKGPFPARVARGSTLHPDHSRAGVRYPVPHVKTLQSEYQACYNCPVGTLARQKARQVFAW